MKQGYEELAVIQENAQEETFLEKLFGTNCFSIAVHALNQDCRYLDQETKSRLAFRLVGCQLRVHGSKVPSCEQKESFRDCINKLSDRNHQLFVEFLTHVDSMCLFIQNHNFDRYTEAILNKLVDGVSFSENQISKLNLMAKNLSGEISETRSSTERALYQLHRAKEIQSETLNIARQHRDESWRYFSLLDAKQTIAIKQVSKQLRLAKQLSLIQENMAAHLSDSQASITLALETIRHQAAALEEYQQSSHRSQEALASNLRSLEQKSQGIKLALDTMSEYQRRSEAMLVRLLGKSYTLEDAVYLIACIALIFSLGAFKSTQGIRLPTVLVLVSFFIIEKWFSEKIHMWFDINEAGNIILNIPQLVLLSPSSQGLEINVRWTIRKIAISTTLWIIGYRVIRFKDESLGHLMLLQDIRRNQEGIREEIRASYLRYIAETRISLQRRNETLEPLQQNGDLKTLTLHQIDNCNLNEPFINDSGLDRKLCTVSRENRQTCLPVYHNGLRNTRRPEKNDKKMHQELLTRETTSNDLSDMCQDDLSQRKSPEILAADEIKTKVPRPPHCPDSPCTWHQSLVPISSPSEKMNRECFIGNNRRNIGSVSHATIIRKKRRRISLASEDSSGEENDKQHKDHKLTPEGDTSSHPRRSRRRVR